MVGITDKACLKCGITPDQRRKMFSAQSFGKCYEPVVMDQRMMEISQNPVQPLQSPESNKPSKAYKRFKKTSKVGGHIVLIGLGSFAVGGIMFAMGGFDNAIGGIGLVFGMTGGALLVISGIIVALIGAIGMAVNRSRKTDDSPVKYEN
jgi:hypothetical protein